MLRKTPFLCSDNCMKYINKRLLPRNDHGRFSDVVSMNLKPFAKQCVRSFNGLPSNKRSDNALH